MDRRDVLALLKQTGITAIYGWYKPGSEPERPYMVLQWLYSSDLGADNVNYFRIDNWQLDLITDKKSESDEASVRDALASAGIRFNQEEINDEGADYVRSSFTFMTR